MKVKVTATERQLYDYRMVDKGESFDCSEEDVPALEFIGYVRRDEDANRPTAGRHKRRDMRAEA